MLVYDEVMVEEFPLYLYKVCVYVPDFEYEYELSLQTAYLVTEVDELVTEPTPPLVASMVEPQPINV